MPEDTDVNKFMWFKLVYEFTMIMTYDYYSASIYTLDVLIVISKDHLSKQIKL